MSRSSAHILPQFLRPPPPAPLIGGEKEIRSAWSHFRPRILFWSTIGYGTFYFVRKNYSMAMP